MNIRPVSEWFLYKYRYAIGYCLLAVAVGVYLFTYLHILPPGISQSETSSVITSAHITFTELPVAIIDLPYHLLQKFSVEFLGLTPLSVRLPSLFFGIMTALFTSLLLHRWFPRNVAIIASVVGLTACWFISTARLGTPTIMIPLWTSFILLAATYISQQSRHWKWWKIGLAFGAALSLYTPFMIFLFIAAIVASFSQPHLRYLIRKSTSFQMTIGTALFLAILAPLGWGLYKDPAQAWQLFGISPQLPGPVQFGKDMLQALSNLFNPYNVQSGETLLPLLSLATCALLLMGGIRLLRDFHAVRSHVLLIWMAILVPIIGFNPNNLIILLIPAILATAIGIQVIIRYWYKLFPLNPYARLFGLLPLALLLLAIIQFNDSRYSYGLTYGADARQAFSNDVFLAQHRITTIDPSATVTIVAPEQQQDLFQLIKASFPNVAVTTAQNAAFTPGVVWIIAADEVPKLTQRPSSPASVIVNGSKENGVRFLVYQP